MVTRAIDWPICFDVGTFTTLAERLHEQYVTAEPYPHIVIDDFLPSEALEAVLAEFPAPSDDIWQRFCHTDSKKSACFDTDKMLPKTRDLLERFNSPAMLEFLENLTGIKDLIPDAHLLGGGMHQIARGGFLSIHADFNVHPKWQLDRRLNVLLFLNKDWKDEYGGYFELWNTAMECHKKVLPVFNRLVVFSTTDTSYHGHPSPLSCPQGMTRKSLALYYYTNGRPDEERSQSHSTLYQRSADQRRRSRFQSVVRKLTPPIVFDLIKVALRQST